MTLTEWSLLGHVLGVLLAAGLAWWGRRNGQQGAKATAMLHGVTSSIDRLKNIAHADQNVIAATALRALTRAITSEATGAGLQNFLDDFLKAHNLNQTPKLRDTRRLTKPEGPTA